MHDTSGSATHFSRIFVCDIHKSDLWHVRLKSSRSTIALQLFDYISHLSDGSNLSLAYGHKTKGISRVFVAHGFEVLLD